MLSRLVGFARDVWKNRRRVTPLPRFLTYTVTYGCNARCVMCDSWKMSDEGQLSVEQVAGILPQLPRMDAVRLTGGEPFVRRDLGEIARLVDDSLRPMALHITTNGMLTDRIVAFCESRRKSTPLHVMVSLDGVEEKHNQIRGSSLAWSKALATLQALAPRAKELGLRLSVNQTIVDPEGIDHYRRLREVLRPLGVRNNVVMAYEASATYNLQKEIELAPVAYGQFDAFGRFDPADIRRLLRETEKDLRQLPWWERLAKRYYLRGIGNRLLAGKSVPCPPCVALQSHLRIYPNGDVPTCQFNSRTVGNLAQQPFGEVWNGEKAQSQRAWVRQCPGCWAECEVMPNAVYTADLLRSAIGLRRHWKDDVAGQALAETQSVSLK
jgi:MoaA/NifB/PqqE/SkfB family radical SAM enzyme